jgi:hypothetical protein
MIAKIFYSLSSFLTYMKRRTHNQIFATLFKEASITFLRIHEYYFIKTIRMKLQ